MKIVQFGKAALKVGALSAFGAVVAIGCGTGSALAEGGGFSSDTVELRYGTQFKEPAISGDIKKDIVNYTHFNTDKYGSNFFTIDALFSDDHDPANNGTKGATEFYAIYRRDFSLSTLTGMKLGVPGLIRDFALHMGGDANSKNTTFAPEKRLLVIGPEIEWEVGKGFFNTSLNYSHEWNYNGIVGQAVTFKPALEFESSWSLPVVTNVSFNGFFNVVAPKGRDGFGNQTKTEILTRPELTFDVGAMAGYKPHKFDIGIAYEYWSNKFGNDHNTTVGALANTPQIIGRIHF